MFCYLGDIAGSSRRLWRSVYDTSPRGRGPVQGVCVDVDQKRYTLEAEG